MTSEARKGDRVTTRHNGWDVSGIISRVYADGTFGIRLHAIPGRSKAHTIRTSYVSTNWSAKDRQTAIERNEAVTNDDDGEPCDCGTVQSTEGFYVKHAAGGHPACTASADDDYTSPDHIARIHSGTEDGYLFYVVDANGDRVTGNGWLNEDGALAELADLEALAALTPAQCAAVEYMRGLTPAPGHYALAVMVCDRVVEYRTTNALNPNVYDAARDARLVDRTMRQCGAMANLTILDCNGTIWEER